MSALISSAVAAQVFSQVGLAADRRQLGGAVHRDPAQDLRRHVVLRLAARLPDALVRLGPDPGGTLGLGLDDGPQPTRAAAALRRVCSRIESSTEPKTSFCRWSKAPLPIRTGLRALVPGQVVAGRLGEVAPAVDAVHDLQAAVLVRFDVGDELHELVGLPVQQQVVQRLQGEGRVAHPGVAVVPVALTARGLRQRRGQGGHGRAGRHVREAFDDQRGTLDVLTQRVVRDPGTSQPAPPEVPGRLQPSGRRRRGRPVRPARWTRTVRRRPSRPACSTCRPRTAFPSAPSARSVCSRMVWPAPVASAVCPSESARAQVAGERP